jgi:ferric enterobactin receptor
MKDLRFPALTLLLLPLLLAVVPKVHGQGLHDIRLDAPYEGSFAEVLLEIGKRHQVVFVFDDSPPKMPISVRPIKEPLDVFLEVHCKELKLKWMQDSAQVVHVVPRYFEFNLRKGVDASAAVDRSRPTRQGFDLSGKVIDAESGEGLPFATLRVLGTQLGTTTNSDGQFNLVGVPSDTSTIQVRYLGYELRNLALSPNSATSGVGIALTPEGLDVDVVRIETEAERMMDADKDFGVLQISPRKLAVLPNIGERDLMRNFQLMPGISAANEASSGLYVRGGTPDQNLVLYDGFTVYQVDHLYGFFSAFNANAIKDVRLHKGGFESKYGGRLASVTEITGKDGNDRTFNAGVDLSLLSVNGWVEAPLGSKITTIFTARRSFKGGLYNKISEQFNSEDTRPQGSGGGPGGGNGGPDFTTAGSSYFYDLNGRVSYTPTTRDKLTLSFFQGTDKLDNGLELTPPAGLDLDFNLDINDLTRYGNTGSSLRWARKWDERLQSSFLVSYSHFFSDRDRSVGGTRTDSLGNETDIKNGILENNDLRDLSAKTDWSLQLGRHQTLEFGLASTRFDIAYTFSQNDTSTILDRDDQGWLHTVYLQDKVKLLGDLIQITPGIRLNHYSPTATQYWEPRAALQIRASKALSFHAATGRYYQFANRVLREDILSGSKEFWILADGASVPVSSAIHYTGGVHLDFKDYFFSAEAYYKDLEGLTEHSLRFSGGGPRGDASYEENFYSGTGYVRGFELLAQRKAGRLNGWLSYTWMQARNQFDVYGAEEFSASQDVTHEFKAVGVYKWRRFSFSGTWIYATGRPYTAPESGYQVTLLDGSTTDFITAGAKNGSRLPDYHRLDLGATYHLVSAKDKERGSVGLSLFNTYNRKNVWYKEYQVLDGTVIETDRQFLGITPNLSLTLKLW